MKISVNIFFKYLLLVCLLCACHLLSANDSTLLNQQKLTDELAAATDDTSKIRIYNALSQELSGSDFNSALSYAQKALDLSNQINSDTGRLNAYYNIALLNDAQGNYIYALEYYFRALKIAGDHEKMEKEAIILNKIGNIYMQQGDYVQALNNHLKSLQIKEELKDTNGISASYNNIGTVFHRQGNYLKAKEYYLKSFQIEKANNRKPGIASSYNNLGVIYEEQRKFDSALIYYQKSIEINEELGNKKQLASTYNNIAFIYDMQGDTEKALEHYFKGLENNKQTGSKARVANSYISIGKYYNSMWEYKKAIEYLRKALNIGREIRSLDLIRLSAKELSLAYSNLERYQEAYENHVLYKKAEDQISNEENVKRFTQLEMQYEFDKKQKAIEFEQKQREMEYKARMKRQRIISASLIAGITMMVLLIFVTYRSYRRKKRDNDLLSQKNTKIELQRDEIEEQKKEITDSIYYASRIQKALLPPVDFIEEMLDDYFILNKPRDIVSGDYYWMNQCDNKVFITAADCTGHGVPGAFMSMLGVAFLNEIVNKEAIQHANEILDELRDYIIKYLHQTGKEGESQDGMDMAMLMIDKDNGHIEFAGAYNPLYLIRDNELKEIKANRMPIGIYKKQDPFSNHVMDVQKGDIFYIFSDGYVDQFGGDKGKKFKSTRFKQLLLDIHKKDMAEQKIVLDHTMEKWKQNYSQIDDILVIGVKC